MFKFPSPKQYVYALKYHQPVYVPGWRPLLPYREIFWTAAGLVALAIILFTIFRIQAVTYYSPTSAIDTNDWSYEIPEQWDTSVSGELPTDMQGLVAKLNLTESGKKIIERTNPRFGTPQEVATDCGGTYSENVVVLGCWMELYDGSEMIIIQNVDSPDYAKTKTGSSPLVTLAHELLHSIYQDVDYNDKQTIYRDLTTDFPEIYSEVGSLGYFSFEIDDEMFTRVGSEKTSGPASAAKIYSKYFKGWQSHQTVSSNPCAPLTCGELSTVSRVVDGDTIEVNGNSSNIRIVGVDTPETVHPSKPVECYGAEASAYLKNLLTGKRVYLVVDTKQPKSDKYGRPLRHVFLEDGTNVAYQIILNGYGYATDYGGNAFTDLFDNAQTKARGSKIGLWGSCTQQGSH